MPSLAALLYVAAAIFLTGMARRIARWHGTPAPLKIVLTPAPKSAGGVALRLVEEVFGFRSLFKASPLFWIPAWLFHVSLLLLLAGHVGGLVMPGTAERILNLTEAQFENLAQSAGIVVGILAAGSLLALLAARLANERAAYISNWPDYFSLGLLLAIIATGDQMRFMDRLDIIQARQFVSGWLVLAPVAPPQEPIFVAHVVLVAALLVFIPFSKLVHLGGAAFFSPTLNQRNDPRDRRHKHECATP